MRYAEIIAEDSQRDLLVANRAREIIKSFRAYLKKYDHVKLRDIPGVMAIRRNRQPLYLFRVKDVCPEVQFGNLCIGIEVQPEPTREASFMIGSQGTVDEKGIVVVTLQGDPGDDTGSQWFFDWEAVAHELVHYFDWRRFRRKHEWHKSNQRDSERVNSRKKSDDPAIEKRRTALDQDRYYNSAKEMNAYFSQGLYAIMEDLVKRAKERQQLAVDDPEWADVFKLDTLGTFELFRDRYMTMFRRDWLKALSPNNKRVFVKRFYKLYSLLKADWPNIDAIDLALISDEEDFRVDDLPMAA